MERVFQDTTIVPENNNSLRELKVDVNQVVSQPSSVGGDLGKLFTIAPGFSEFGRLGRKIRIKQIRCRGCLGSSLPFADVIAGTNPSDILRVVIVLDKQANQGTPTVAALFPYINSLSVYNWYESDRYVILDDQSYITNPIGAIFSSTALTGVMINQCKLYTTCIDCDIPVTFGQTSFGEKPTTNDIYWMVLNSGFLASTFSFLWETFYEDM